MRIYLPAALVLVALVVACGGCKAPNFQDRLDDCGEMVRLNLGAGPGLLANVHVTRCLALGIGGYESRRYGFRNGYGWMWDERRYDTNLVIPIYGWEDVDAVLYGGMPKTLLRGDDRDSLRPGEERGFWRWAGQPLTLKDRNRGWFEVSVNLHLIWIGLDVGVDVGEILDAALGWFGIDPAMDDEHTDRPVERHDPDPVPAGSISIPGTRG